ncbi:MAG: DNA polymerase IV [Chloroflexi bacterium]|nr:DNA polymerase IV [Chloroflexota bacterium]
MMDRRIMHVDLDAFFVSVEQVLKPELRGRPVVVGGRPDRRGVVAAASYEARRFGLHSGMSLAAAYRLCPQAVFIEGSFARYRDASRKFMAILADFSPYLEPGGLDEAYLDVTGFESLHGSIREMAAGLKRRVKEELGLCASVGIAGCKVVAKVASDRSKPDGLLEVPPGGERDFLSPLSVASLPGVGGKSEQVLKGLGILTIGQLAAASPEMLKRRFGVFGEVLHDRANGIDPGRVEPPGEAKSMSRETTFEKDTRSGVLLRATLRYLSERLGSELRRQGKQAKCVSLKLRYADFTTLSRQRALGQGTDGDQTIFETGCKLLDAELGRDRRAVRLIGIGVSGLGESGKQLDMLDPSALKFEKLESAIDRIRKRYGFTAIQTGRTLLLRDIFLSDDNGYHLHTPGLSR